MMDRLARTHFEWTTTSSRIRALAIASLTTVKVAAVCLAAMLTATTAHSRQSSPVNPPLPAGVGVAARFEPSRAAAGTIVELQVSMQFPSGWIAFDFEQSGESAMPARITLGQGGPLVPLETFAAPPAIEKRDVAFDGRFVRYFETCPTFRRRVLISREARPGPVRMEGSIDIQLRNEATGKSYLVLKQPFVATMEVVDAATKIEPARPSLAPVRQDSPAQSAVLLPTKSSAAPAKTSEVAESLPKVALPDPPRTMPVAGAEHLSGPRTVAPTPTAPDKPRVPLGDVSKPPATAPAPEIPSGQWLYDDPALTRRPTAGAAAKANRVFKQPSRAVEIALSDQVPAGATFVPEDAPAGDWRIVWLTWFGNAGWSLLPAIALGLLAGSRLGSLFGASRSLVTAAGATLVAGGAGSAMLFAPRMAALWLVLLASLLAAFKLIIEGAVASEDPSEGASGNPWELVQNACGLLLGHFCSSAAVALVAGGGECAVSSWIGSTMGLIVGCAGALAVPRTSILSDEQMRAAAVEPRSLHPADAEPDLAPLLLGLAVLAYAVDLGAQLDLFDGKYDWLSYYHVVAGWGACSAVGLLRLLAPWPESTRNVFRRPARLLAALMLAWLALLCVAAAGEDPRTDGMFRHLLPRPSVSQLD